MLLLLCANVLLVYYCCPSAGGAVPSPLTPSLCVFPLQFIEEAGFSHVRAEDRTAQFIQVIETELQRAEAIKDEFIEVSMHTHTRAPTCSGRQYHTQSIKVIHVKFNPMNRMRSKYLPNSLDECSSHLPVCACRNSLKRTILQS